MVSKKKKGKSKNEAKPMPSLVFHEGQIDPNSETPLADLVERELLEPIAENYRPVNTATYNPAAKRLMWFAVITLMLVISGLWAWSIQAKFSTIKWSRSPEGNMISKIEESWHRSVYDERGNRMTTDQLKTEVQKNLVKLFGSAAASSTPTTTASVIQSPTSTILPN